MHLHDLFTKYGYVVLRNLAPRPQIDAFCCEIQKFTSRRVICGIEGVSWDEQVVSPDSSLSGFFRADPIVKVLSDCLGRSVSIEHLACWTSRYKLGEYINRHTDRAGDIQLILSLKAAGADNGGWLNLDFCGNTSRVFLQGGDALCFLATAVEHFTDPLIGTSGIPNPERIIAVGRYFLAND